MAERIEKIQRQQAHLSVKTQIMADFAAFCEQAQQALENQAPAVKQEVLRLLIESIVVEENAIIIKRALHNRICLRKGAGL